ALPISVAEDVDLAVLDRQADEPADETLAIVPDQLTRPVDVGEPQRAGADAEHVIVEQVIVLAGGLVDAVDVDRPHEVRLVDGQAIRLAVHLARAREDHLHAGILVTTGFEHRQLCAAVDLEIGERIEHAVDVAHLAGEVENDLAIADQDLHGRSVSYVRNVHAHPVGDAMEVEQIAAVLGNHGVDEEHVRSELDEPPYEIAADEAQASGD